MTKLQYNIKTAVDNCDKREFSMSTFLLYFGSARAAIHNHISWSNTVCVLMCVWMQTQTY